MVEDDPERRALNLWEEGTKTLLSGDVEGAIELFTKSLEVRPTAEAYTFRGWAHAHRGEYEKAIEECRKAIATDPTFGNPYNDIGSYLLGLGREDEAVPWFLKAKRAPRYEPRHFPYLNLGRLFFDRGKFLEAMEEFATAAELNPGDPVALAYLEKLKLKIN